MRKIKNKQHTFTNKTYEVKILNFYSQLNFMFPYIHVFKCLYSRPIFTLSPRICLKTLGIYETPVIGFNTVFYDSLARVPAMLVVITTLYIYIVAPKICV